MPLPVPYTLFNNIIVNFITNLPPSKYNGLIYDTLVIFMDKFTKIAYYILIIKILDT